MATTQQVIDDTKKLLERVKTEGITTNSGQLINPADYNKPISADMLATPQTAVQLPPQPTDNTNYSGLTAGGNAEINSLTSTATATTDPNEMPAWVKTFLENQPTPTNPSDTYNTLYNSSGIDEKQKAVNESQNRINALKAQLEGIDIETKQAGLKLKDEGISAGAIYGRNIANERQAAIRSLPIQAQILAEQATLTGNTALLDQATSKLNTAFQLQSQYETQQFQYNQNLIDKVWDFASKDQQNKLLQKQKDEENKFTLLRDNLAYARDLATTAITNGQGALAGQIASLDIKSPTYSADLARLAGQIKGKTTSDIIGSAESGYYNIVKDANGNIISKTPVIGGDGGGGGGIPTGKIETSFREDGSELKRKARAGEITIQEAYNQLRDLYTPAEVSDKYIKDYLGITYTETPTPSMVNPAKQLGNYLGIQPYQSNQQNKSYPSDVFSNLTYNFLFNK